MRKKVFFLLQSSIIFLLIADIGKVLFRYNAWLKLSMVGFCFSIVGIIFIEYYTKNKAKQPKKVVNMKKKVPNQYKDFVPFLIIIMVIIAIVIIFIKGVLLEEPMLLEVLVSEVSFVIGAVCWLVINKSQD